MSALRIGLQLSSALVGVLLGGFVTSSCSEPVEATQWGPICQCPKPVPLAEGRFRVTGISSPEGDPSPLSEPPAATLVVAAEQVSIEYDRAGARIRVLYDVVSKGDADAGP